MSLFMYAIEVWACAYEGKYLSCIDKFCKRAVKFGYTSRYTPIKDLITVRGQALWKKLPRILSTAYITLQRARDLRDHGHKYILPRIHTERFKRSFVNRCLLNFI